VKEIFAEQPGRPKPVLDHAPSIPLVVMPPQSDVPVQSPGVAAAKAPETAGAPSATTQSPDGNGIALAAASFIEAGLKLIESFASDVTNGHADSPPKGLDHALSALFTRDARTNGPALTIPLPESVTRERLAGALSALLTAFGKAGASVGREGQS